MRHVVWDWNGTLLNDGDLVVAALNDTLASYGVEPLTVERYRLLYTRPVQVFYARVFGRELTPPEWVDLDRRFHDAYDRRLAHVSLTHDARDALERVSEEGRTQSLLSMYRHDDLVPLVRRLGVLDHFVRVDGLRGPGGGLKAGHLEAHLAEVAHHFGADPSSVLVIGDALDDAAAALHVGARCILYDGGTHPRADLEAAGVPVVDRLSDALSLADLT